MMAKFCENYKKTLHFGSNFRANNILFENPPLPLFLFLDFYLRIFLKKKAINRFLENVVTKYEHT